MADIDDAPVNGNGEPLGTAPEAPKPAETAPASEVPAAPEFEFVPAPAETAEAVAAPGAEPGGVSASVATPVEAAPAPEVVAPIAGFAPEQLPLAAPDVTVPVAAAIATEPEPDVADGLTGQLQALSDSLEPPVTAEETPADPAAGQDEAIAEQPAAAAATAPETAPADEAAATAAEFDAATGTDATEAAGEAGVADAEAASTEAGAAEVAVGEATEPAEGEATEGAATAAEGEAAGESLDDIAPGTVAAEAVAATATEGEEAAALPEVEGPRTTVSWWPFIAYIVVWLGAAAYAVWQLQQLPPGVTAYETNFYTMSMLGGLVLLAAGPVLLLIVWLASWIGHKGARVGLMFISALMKGALATLIGAVIWIGAIVLVDYLRLGRPF